MYAFTQRSYPPLKSRNLPIMYLLYISMVCWFVGSIYVNHSSYMPKSWLICVATFSWLRMSLGVYLFFALFQIRVYFYISIFIWRRAARGKLLWALIAYQSVLSLAYAIVAAVLPKDLGYEYYADSYTCMNHNAIYYVGIGLVVFQFAVSLGLTFKARKINSRFNEFREFVVILTFTFVAGVISICTRMIRGLHDRRSTVDVLDTVAQFIPTQAYFFVVLGPPIYHSIVDRERHLAYFMSRMVEANLVRQYDMASNAQLIGNGALNHGPSVGSSVIDRPPGSSMTEDGQSGCGELSRFQSRDTLMPYPNRILV
ncbi:hypothetical protein GQ54DRAFT_307515 [Martensiomyces pterosporus]|nr:hypothetical protein GQ54DRAFT_307515 [Martensiomyces pterosporus]